MAGKQETGSAALGMGGYHAARTGRTGAALPATRSVDAPLSRTRKCPAARNGRCYVARNEKCCAARSGSYYTAGNGRYYTARNGAPVGHISERSSATAIARLLYCQACFLPSLPAVLISLLDCQVCRIARPAGSEEFPVFCRYIYDVITWEPGTFGKA